MPGSYKRGRLQRPLCPGNQAGKYLIAKSDGSEVDPTAQYFVLRVDADPHARHALAEYAESVKKENPLLAHDIVHWLAELYVQKPLGRRH